MKKEGKNYNKYGTALFVTSIIVGVLITFWNLIIFDLYSSYNIIKFINSITFLIISTLAWLSLLILSIKNKKSAGTLGIIIGTLLCFSIINFIFGIILIVVSSLYLKYFKKQEQNDEIISNKHKKKIRYLSIDNWIMPLPIASIIIGIYSTFAILLSSAFALSGYNSPINNPNFVLWVILITSIIAYLSLFILSIRKKESAGILGITIGIILCLTIINIIPGVILIIISSSYLNSFPKRKNKNSKKTKINTEYGQKIVYAKSFDENNDNEENDV